MRKLILAIVLMACWQSYALSQAFGGNPATTSWRQQNNQVVKVVYPKGMDSIAANISMIAEKLAANPQTVGNKVKKITILLQPALTRSNGYVALGPWRSEYFNTPPQNPFELGSQEWNNNLAVHEFRHVQQFSNYNVGLTKFASTIFGQLGQALATSAAVPDWFFEGDAVWSETKYSNIGRGRLPLFFNEHKAIYQSGKWYKWMKWRNGSLKDMVPNHYPTGYILTAYGRQQYGDTVWNRITEDAARFKALFYPMQNAFRSHTGKDYSQFTTEAFDFFKTQWQQENKNHIQPAWITETERNNVLDYKYPYPIDDNRFIAVKRSYRDIPQIVIIDKNGEEEKITVRDIDNDDYFSYSNGRVVYTYRQPNKRWGNIDYSNIRVVDTETKSGYTIFTKGKYFSPDIDKDGKLIVAVNVTNTQPCMLHLLDNNGNVQAKATMSADLFYSHPKFLPDGETIVAAARNTIGEMYWVSWNFKTNEWQELTKPALSMIGFPVVQNNAITFTATNSDYDGLFRLTIDNKQLERIATTHTGIYQGFVRGSEVVGAYFTNKGLRIGVIPINTEPMPGLKAVSNLYVGDQINGTALMPKSNHNETAEHYRKTTKLFNFHSLVPTVSESDITLSLLGQNVLNTLQSNLYYTYNNNEGSHRLGYTGIFGQWYLQPLVNVSQTWNRSFTLNADTTLRFNETNFSGGIRLPLNLTKGRQFRSLVLQSTYNYEEIKWTGLAERLARNNDFTFIDNRIIYSSLSQQALQHILPRWGQQASLTYQTSLSSRKAWQTQARVSFFLPGFAKTHNLLLQAAWQGRDTALNYIYTNNFPFARGYTRPNFPRMWRLAANYHFPLLYPDWGFGNIVYFRRVRANAYFDHSATKSLRTGVTRYFNSTGVEVFFDTRWWNQQNLSFGFRYSRLLDQDLGGRAPNQWEFILPINLLNL